MKGENEAQNEEEGRRKQAKKHSSRERRHSARKGKILQYIFLEKREDKANLPDVHRVIIHLLLTFH